MTDSPKIENMHRSTFQAMNTIFELTIINDDQDYAKQAAWAAYDELQRIENMLSSFISHSEISRLNRLEANTPTIVDLDVLECLTIALEVYEETNHAFDITIGTLFKCLLDKDKTLRTPTDEELKFAKAHTGSNLIKLSQDDFTVELLASPVKIDLGAIGKGFALDKMADLLRQWSIDSAMLSAGGSTVLAMDPPKGHKGFPVTVNSQTDPEKLYYRLELANIAFSSSGLIDAPHIIDPRTAKTVSSKLSSWASAKTAAKADAISTALIVMSPKEIKAYAKKHPDQLLMYATKSKLNKNKEKIKKHGNWPKQITPEN